MKSIVLSAQIMALFLHCSIFYTLCRIQVTTGLEDYQPVTFMKSRTELIRMVDSSPTKVLRALKNINARLNARIKSIVTEKLFENVVKEWMQQIQATIISHQKVSEYQISLYTLSHSKEYILMQSSRIFLLTPEKLKHWIINFQEQSFPATYDIIIGTCLPKFFINKPRINMIIPVQTQYWIHPSNSKQMQKHWIKRDNVPFLVQRTSLHNWRAISLEYHMDICHLNNQTRNLYGLLQHFSIRFSIGELKDNKLFSNIKNGKPAGILPNFLEYVFEYLKLTLLWQICTGILNCTTNYKHNWPGDFPEIPHSLEHNSGSHTWPQLFKDGLTVVAKMKTRSMTLARLISLFKYKVWIAVIVTLCLLNLGFYFAFDGSPSLKQHPKLKNKSRSKLMRILLFDSLIRFQGEWTAGPVKSVKILLMAFNIYLFITLNAFMAKFSVQILSRRYFPLNKLSDICHYQGACFKDNDLTFHYTFNGGISVECGFKLYYDTFNYSDAVRNNFECIIKDIVSFLRTAKREILL